MVDFALHPCRTSRLEIPSTDGHALLEVLAGSSSNACLLLAVGLFEFSTVLTPSIHPRGLVSLTCMACTPSTLLARSFMFDSSGPGLINCWQRPSSITANVSQITVHAETRRPDILTERVGAGSKLIKPNTAVYLPFTVLKKVSPLHVVSFRASGGTSQAE